jgi:hypothetical protein
MICYQIADLHRMAQTGLLENPLRYYGIVSPTGHPWSLLNASLAGFFSSFTSNVLLSWLVYHGSASCSHLHSDHHRRFGCSASWTP